MRVLHVINQFSGRAGAEVSLADLVRETHGHAVVHGVAVLKSEPNDFSSIDALGVARFVPRTPAPGRFRAMQHVRAAIRAFRPDLVHTSLFEADVAGRVAARLGGVPAVTSLVNTTYAASRRQAEPVSQAKLRGARAIDRLLARHATIRFHAITDAVARDAVDGLGVSREAIVVIPRGRRAADLGDPSPERRDAARRRLGLDADTSVVINVARQEPQKGQRSLLAALAHLRADLPDVVLLMVGREGRSTAALRAQAQELRLDRSIRWLGVRRDVPDLLVAADVFAFPSLYEGLGGAALEAMALRVPIVAADVPALREILDDGRAGQLVPPNDHGALATAIVRTLAGGPQVQAAVERAERRFHENYELATVTEQMLALYRLVLATAPALRRTT